ncbi:regulator of G-protein signaling 10 isoform X4 [Moschus berezovskii]|uniref:regulator of G-protein signaling 10 isoform X4 n=1 Tax=Moschus berezovskii TaxID=68408 RepID=UPI002444DA02|nr:regulator of G-protein signaling 10 isoform X4 [Moschus berezovskii]
MLGVVADTRWGWEARGPYTYRRPPQTCFLLPPHLSASSYSLHFFFSPKTAWIHLENVYMQEKAKEIYMTFLSSKASSQVNVEGQSRLNEKILEEPHPLMFQKLQDQIFNLMKYDSYSRFLKSDLFLKHKRTEEEDEESPDAQTAAKRASRIYNT